MSNGIIYYVFFFLDFVRSKVVGIQYIFIYNVFICVGFLQWLYIFFFSENILAAVQEKSFTEPIPSRGLLRENFEKSQIIIYCAPDIISTRHTIVYAYENIISRSFSRGQTRSALVQVRKTRLGNVFRRPRRRFIISFELDTIDIRPRRSRSARQRQRFFLFTVATAQHRLRCLRETMTSASDASLTAYT